MTNTSKKPPVAKIRIGNVTATIWGRETEKRTFYTVTLERGYKDQQGQWKSTDSLDPADIQNARKALDMAHTKILELEAIDRDQAVDSKTGEGA